MGTVNITDITDGTTADADDVNSRLTAITDQVNGNLDSNNIATGGVGTNQLADNAVTAAKQDFVGCTVGLSANQSIATSTATKIQFDDEDFDIGSNFDTGNNRFEAPVTGYYQVTVQVMVDNLGANDQVRSYIYINGSEYAQNRDYAGSAGDETVASVTRLCQVTAGQYIEGYAWHNYGSNRNLNASGKLYTFMSIQLVGV